MGKLDFKPGNMLYPLPAVLVTSRSRSGEDNVFTVAWTGTVCTNPPMLYISVRPERYSYQAIADTGEFAVNLTTSSMVRAVDFCGVRSGRDTDKFAVTGLTRMEAALLDVPLIEESPVNIECRVKEILPLGSHHMFIADVVHVTVDGAYMDEKGTFHLEKADPVVYSHGTYFDLGKARGSFGYSVRKKTEKLDKTEKPDQTEKIEKTGKIKKKEKLDKTGKVPKAEKPGNKEKSGNKEKPGKTDKPRNTENIKKIGKNQGPGKNRKKKRVQKREYIKSKM